MRVRQRQVQIAEPQCLFRAAFQDRIEIFKSKQFLSFVGRNHRACVVLRHVHHANNLGTITVTLGNEGGGTVETTEQECAREIVFIGRGRFEILL